MNAIDAFIYGIIQGLSEFLPVSSSGHLALLPHVMQIQDPGVVFDLMMHIGTALAVGIYFKKEIMSYARTLTPSLIDLKQGTTEQWFTRNFIFSTFVSVSTILVLMPLSKMARDPYIIVFNLSVFGALLWLADYLNGRRQGEARSMETGMQWMTAAAIGFAQALAIFPGVSRSGITLTAALLLGMRRKDAGAFSFLMSLPIIAAGILKEIPELMHASSEKLHVLLVGILTSFVVGFLTIHFFMKLIGRLRLMYFTFYRWILAIAMVWLLS